MRINVLLPYFGTSGGIRSVIEITNRLIERGHEVTLITSHVPSTLPRTTDNPIRTAIGCAFGTVSRLTENIDWLPVRADKKKIPILEPRFDGLLERWIPDADCTIATAWQTAYPAATLSNAKGQKFYFIQHYEIWPIWNESSCWEAATKFEGRPSVDMTRVVPNSPQLKKYKRLVDESHDLPLNLIITSEWEEDVLDELGHDHCGKIKYGVDFDTFYPHSNRNNDNTTILALYRNSPEKGDKQAVESFKSLYNSHPDINYVMFGTTDSPEIPDFVEFHEDPSQDSIRTLYSSADIFVYPSWVEGYGMPPMEAMACKTALVSTDVGAVREYSPEDYVKFVPVRATEPIVTAVRELLNEPNAVEKMKQECYKHVQQFTWEKATDQFEDCIRNA